MFDGWPCSYWPSYLHCQHSPCDSYNPPQWPALLCSRVHRDNCLLWVDRECLSAGTCLSCPSTPHPSSHLWFSLECHHVSILMSGSRSLGMPFLFSLTVPQQEIVLWAKSSNRSGEEKKLSMYVYDQIRPPPLPDLSL